jgi:hypothetical protein
VSIEVPSLDDSEDSEAAGGRFIVDATIHLLGSSAVFIVRNPCRNGTVTIDSIHATAYYNGSDIANIDVEELDWIVAPGVSASPFLPVSFKLSDVARDLLKRALGGTIYLDAFARVGFNIDNLMGIQVNYTASGVGAKVRL